MASYILFFRKHFFSEGGREGEEFSSKHLKRLFFLFLFNRAREKKGVQKRGVLRRGGERREPGANGMGRNGIYLLFI